MAKRKNYFIYAYDEMYGGLHGMYDYSWGFEITEEDACLEGYQLSSDVIDSYSCIYESFEDDEEREMDIAYEVWEIKDGVTYEDIRRANQAGMTPREIIEKFCKTT